MIFLFEAEKRDLNFSYLMRAAAPFSTAVAVVVGKQSQRCTALPDVHRIIATKTLKKHHKYRLKHKLPHNEMPL